MKNSFFLGILEILRNSGRIGLELSRKMFLIVRRLSWPQMVFASIGVIVLVAILHLALFLFIVFMVFKLVLGFNVFNSYQQSRSKHDQARNKSSEPYTIDM